MREKNSDEERRKHFRVTPSISKPVYTSIDKEYYNENTLPVKDISLGGVAFFCPGMNHTPPLGGQIQNMKLSLPDLGDIQANGIVRRVEHESPDQSVCALEFTHLPNWSTRKLFGYLNNRQRELRWFSRN